VDDILLYTWKTRNGRRWLQLYGRKTTQGISYWCDTYNSEEFLGAISVEAAIQHCREHAARISASIEIDHDTSHLLNQTSVIGRIRLQPWLFGATFFAGSIFLLCVVAYFGASKQALTSSNNSSIAASAPTQPIAPSTYSATTSNSVSASAATANPDRWKDQAYTPNEADFDLAAKRSAAAGLVPQGEMKAALCAFYGTCR
jgi:hypothetical protein